MKMRWKKLLLKITSWFVAEISLNYVGLDSLADYSEFLTQLNVNELGKLSLTQQSGYPLTHRVQNYATINQTGWTGTNLVITNH